MVASLWVVNGVGNSILESSSSVPMLVLSRDRRMLDQSYGLSIHCVGFWFDVVQFLTKPVGFGAKPSDI